jgi:hypothetical protein
VAFALMIRGGIATAQAEAYLHAPAWLTDAARLLDPVQMPSTRTAGQRQS